MVSSVVERDVVQWSERILVYHFAISRCLPREFEARYMQDFQYCVLGLGTIPSSASLHSGVNEYLVGQIWQLSYDKLLAPHSCSAVCSPGG